MPRNSPRTKMMTEPAIAKLKPRDGKRTEFFDAAISGLMLRVSGKGRNVRRVWAIGYRLGGGNYTKLSIGDWVTEGQPGGLVWAREEAVTVKALVKHGIDPREHRQMEADKAIAKAKAEKAEAEAEAERRVTFGTIAEKYADAECGHLARGKEIERQIENFLLPQWADIAIEDMTKRDLSRRYDAVLKANGPQAAHKVQEIARRIVRWADKRGEIGHEPFGAWEPTVKRQRRTRTLLPRQLRLLWLACDQVGYPVGPALKLLLLTGLRRGEVANARWREFDLDAAVWIVPAERMKMSEPLTVPLSRLVVELLRSLRDPKEEDSESSQRFKRGDFLFSTTSGEKPIQGWTKFKAAIDAAIDEQRGPDDPPVEPYTIHDLRRVVRSGMAALGVRYEVAEAVLGHTKKGVHSNYDMHAYEPERREALEIWATRLLEIVETSPPEDGNVVRLKSATA